MRTNLPVTQKHYDFPADQTLISVTDLKGRITYCNTNFVNVSGFSREELLGQPHNIVRHPDMPEEAFRDMWHTILERGQPWTALVKNRRKNGDHYWVRANATPVRSGERIVGFLSVRTKPSADEIATYEQLYARMRAEKAAGRLVHVLDGGVVVRRGFSVVYDAAANIFAQFELQKFSRDLGDSQDAKDETRRYLNCDLLIIDDLGSEFTTPFVQSAMYTIINTRLVKNKCTVISSNLSMPESERRYTPQAASRLKGEYRGLPFVGDDIRLLKK